MKNQLGTSKFFCIIGILAGILGIFMALVLFNYSTGSFVRSEAYGGDAHTGIQNAAASTGNNVMQVACTSRLGFAALLLVIGLALISHFGLQLINYSKVPAPSAMPEGTDTNRTDHPCSCT